MLNCIRLRIILLTVMLIFCDSHEKQLDEISLSSTLTTDDTVAVVDDNLIQSDIDDEAKTRHPTTDEFEMISTKLESKESMSLSSLNSTIDFSISQPPTTKSTETESILSEDKSVTTTSNNMATIDTSTSTLSQSNFSELTTEKLSLTNKSLLFSQPMAESQTRDISDVAATKSSINSSKTLNMKQQRVINSNVFHPLPDGNSHKISKGQKIEMPQLNDFFDHSEYLKKHERGFRYGPHFETGNVTNITVQVGNTFYLHCKISLLQDKTVSWVMQKSGDRNMELLTVGKQTYAGDPRYSVDFQYPNNWRLKIESVQKVDEGTYKCQISTSPPRYIYYNVKVNAPTIRIVDEKGIPLLDKYYEVDSTIQLTCIVRHISMMSSVVYWIHNNSTILNFDVTRGGISVKSDLMEIGANSTLLIAKVNKTDSGNYTCSIGGTQQYTVLVHVLNEESLAELHHSGAVSMLHINVNTAWKFDYLNLILFMIALLSSSLYPQLRLLCIKR